MTIPKNLQEREQNKKNDKMPEAKVPLTGVEDGGAVIAVANIERRRSTARLVCLVLGCLLLLLIAGLTTYYIYNYKIQRRNRGMCGVGYVDTEYPTHVEDPQAYKSGELDRRLEEEIEVDLNRELATIHVPSFDECRAAIIMHDFEKAYSVIVDIDHFRCFVWPLNTTQIMPPRNLWDMVAKMKSRYYLPNLRVIRQDFRVIWPPVQDLAKYGPYIREECEFYDTFWLDRVQFTGRVKKRSAKENEMVFGEFGNEQNLVKYNLIMPRELSN